MRLVAWWITVLGIGILLVAACGGGAGPGSTAAPDGATPSPVAGPDDTPTGPPPTTSGTDDPALADACALASEAQIAAIVGREITGTESSARGQAGQADGRCRWLIAPPEFPPIEGEVTVEFELAGDTAFDDLEEFFSDALEATDALGAARAAWGPGDALFFVDTGTFYSIQVLGPEIDERAAAVEVARLIQGRPRP